MRLVAAVLAASFCVLPVQAGENAGPLEPGKPAGVQKAQAGDRTILYIIGAGMVVGGIALVAGSSGHSTPTGSSTSSGTSSSGTGP